ncbi:ERF family protein [Lactobacillus hominis]|uniref:DNA single-strand annealing protein n=1 Tax=Lactobacillus hominis DSM 23910 = CRBIP 24.179 TaxID=1423758 RepID=I7JUP8_9LACO|nr:ERF family protein [Lactobacillus hominis]KRM85868.1 hypothetical protein FC41_GL000058 [Lactobacillus hominis DSM 23910 = CRBIP 24.179]MCT3348895.1 hypothetical protein [Lactobacillus hominis]CCI81581.1 DNA single-strand annealing protein [Lactobacillus hominis DSM 23910 = CRBIP 24.179]
MTATKADSTSKAKSTKQNDSAFRSIQEKMSVSKTLNNSYGKFDYFNLELVLNVLKPLLAKHNARLVLKTEPMTVGNYLYQNATAKYIDPDFEIETSYAAREDAQKKGMDAPQISGSAASYAKKGALANLFLIDDGSTDPDSNKYHGTQQAKTTKPARTPKQAPTKAQSNVNELKKYTDEELTRQQVKYNGATTNIFNVYSQVLDKKSKDHENASKWWRNWFNQPTTPQGNLIRQFTEFYLRAQKAKEAKKES